MKKGRLLGATLLITGTCVGAGMLGLPIATGPAGLMPALVINVLTWGLMLITGLLFLEATLALPNQSNLISISRHFLGPLGAKLSGGAFVFLYTCLMVAYISGGAPYLASLLPIPAFASYILFALIFGSIVLWGTRAVDRVNHLLMIFLILSYVLLVTFGFSKVETSYYSFTNWPKMMLATPILFSAYGYHNILPSLATYLHRDRKMLRLAVIIGTVSALVIYSLWQCVVLGLISPEALLQPSQEPVTSILQKENSFMGPLSGIFGFAALTTSVLGVSLSMVDFFADGFKIKPQGKIRFGLVLLVFIPPLILTSINPDLFMTALGLAGGFGEVILNALIPIAAGFGLRKMSRAHSSWLNHPVTLIILTILSLAVMGIEIAHLLP